MRVRLSYTDHLVSLVAETAEAAGRIGALPADELDGLTASARRESARLSAQLDASPLAAETLAAVDQGTWQRPSASVSADRAGGWASTLRLDGMATQEVAAVEYDNLLRLYDTEDELAEGFFDEPLATLSRVHGLVCQGLVEPEVIGRPRRTEQAVHDGAQGMVIFNAPDHETLPGLLDGLQGWLRGAAGEGSAAYPAPVVAGVVHERLLQWQPYEAGNGRVARAASRLVLRARGFDPRGVAVPERVWSQDPAAYYGEVAATLRRRDDLGPWVERYLESLSAALIRILATVAGGRVPASSRAAHALARLQPGETITVAEYARRMATSRETAARDLKDLMIGGHVVREPKSLGRRFRRL